MRYFLLLAAAVFLFAGSLSAISLYVGVLEGTVTTDDGTVLKDVKVVAVPSSASAPSCEALAKKKGSQNATTGPNGKYKFVALRPGMYTLCYGLSSYQTVLRKTEIKESVTSRIDIVLKKSEASQTQTQP